MEDVDNVSEDEEEEEEEEEEKALKKRKGKGKSKKDLKTHFMLHGPAKGGAKALGTKETRAEVNAHSPHLEQLYQRTKGILNDEYGLSTTQLRHHFVRCLVPCSAIIPIDEFLGEEDPVAGARAHAKWVRQDYAWSLAAAWDCNITVITSRFKV